MKSVPKLTALNLMVFNLKQDLEETTKECQRLTQLRLDYIEDIREQESIISSLRTENRNLFSKVESFEISAGIMRQREFDKDLRVRNLEAQVEDWRRIAIDLTETLKQVTGDSEFKTKPPRFSDSSITQDANEDEACAAQLTEEDGSPLEVEKREDDYKRGEPDLD